VSTFGFKISATGLTFLTSVLLARMLGKAGYGTYAYALAWLGVLGFPVALGLDQLLVRKTAAWRQEGSWGQMRGLFRRSIQTVLAVSLAVSLLAAGVVQWFSLPPEASMRQALLVALILLPLVGLLRICESSMRGLQAFPWAYLPEMLVRPLLFCGLVAGAYFWRGTLAAHWAMALNGGGVAAALLLGLLLLRRAIPREMKQASPVFETAGWLRTAWPLWLLTVVVMVNAQTDVIMLGSLLGPAATGVYVVAVRCAQMLGFIMVAVDAVLGPTIAALHAAGETDRLQALLTRSARTVLALTLPVALAIVLLGHWILLIFGEPFTAGRGALTVLCVGQLVSAGTGSVLLILVMTGHDWQALCGMAGGTMLNILLNALLIPRWGIEGAALATVVSMVLLNLILLLIIRRRLRLDPSAIGWYRA